MIGVEIQFFSPLFLFFSPNIGDMVLAATAHGSAEDGNAWNRARILSVGNSGLYRVSFCDSGRTGTVKIVKQIPKDLASFPEFAARCSIVNSTKCKEKLESEVSRNTPLLRLLINCGFSPLFI